MERNTEMKGKFPAKSLFEQEPSIDEVKKQQEKDIVIPDSLTEEQKIAAEKMRLKGVVELESLYEKYESRSKMGGAVKNDGKKPRMSLVPILAKMEVAKCMTYGAEKYSAYNWSEGFEYTVLADAAERHIDAWRCGEDFDRESGLRHLSHAVCSLMMLLENTLLYKDKYDDRWGGWSEEKGKEALNEALRPYNPLDFVKK